MIRPAFHCPWTILCLSVVGTAWMILLCQNRRTLIPVKKNIWETVNLPKFTEKSYKLELFPNTLNLPWTAFADFSSSECFQLCLSHSTTPESHQGKFPEGNLSRWEKTSNNWHRTRSRHQDVKFANISLLKINSSRAEWNYSMYNMSYEGNEIQEWTIFSKCL